MRPRNSPRFLCTLALPLSLGLTAASADEAPPPRHVQHRQHPGAPGHDPGPHHGPLVHRFEDPARWAKEFDDPKRDAWQKPQEIVARMQLKPGMTVVDLGAGTGYLLSHLARAVAPGGTVLALDVEAGMVKYLTERALREKIEGVKAAVVPLDDPKLTPGSADRVVLLDVWHHVPDRIAYAKKIAAGLKPDGALFIVDFTKESSRGPHKRHRLTPDEVQAELRAAGLRTEVVEETLPDHYIVAGRKAAAPAPAPPSPPPASKPGG